ncbi:hypothetical protein [Candidatus Sodalis pierantonius]|nr:hypothetical protein [Candidatus Sodalis pierantonius]
MDILGDEIVMQAASGAALAAIPVLIPVARSAIPILSDRSSSVPPYSGDF